MELKESVAIVTGASRGIGRAIAVALAEAGADVVCAARATDDAPGRLAGTIDETARLVEKLGRRALSAPCDVRNGEEVEALVEQTTATFGRVDMLINNAAVNYRAPLFDTPSSRWNLILDVNLRGSLNCIAAVLPAMIEQKRGAIVNISSGVVGDPARAAALGIIPYAVSKAALEALTTSLAAEVGPAGVAVSCLRIEGAVATEGAREVSPDADFSAWLAPESVAHAARLLAAREPADAGQIMTVAEALGDSKT